MPEVGQRREVPARPLLQSRQERERGDSHPLRGGGAGLTLAHVRHDGEALPAAARDKRGLQGVDQDDGAAGRCRARPEDRPLDVRQREDVLAGELQAGGGGTK